MDKVEIIQLSSKHWEDYKNLRLVALKSNPESFGETLAQVSKRTESEWKRLLYQTFDGRKRWVFFASVDGSLIGMVSGTAMKALEKGVKIQEMFVLEEFRGEGVAKKLMESLINELLKNSDRKILRLGVFKSQTEAVNLYKSLGFEVLEEKTESFPGGITHQSIVMEKRLDTNFNV